jgi:hypothetical protein
MGYNTNITENITHWVESGYLRPKSNILEFGSQIVEGKAEMLKKNLISFSDWIDVEQEEFERFLDQMVLPLPAMSIFQMFGFNYKSIDINGEYNSIFFDLNIDSVSHEYLNYFDFVNNQGTTEHVLNQLNSLKVAHDFTKPGGFMRHSVPISGWFDHGYVYPTLKFWYELAGCNNYTMASKSIIHCGFRKKMPEWYNDTDEHNYLGKTSIADSLPFDISKEFWYSDLWFEIILKKNSKQDFVVPLDHLENDMDKEIRWKIRKNYNRLFSEKTVNINIDFLKPKYQVFNNLWGFFRKYKTRNKKISSVKISNDYLNKTDQKQAQTYDNKPQVTESQYLEDIIPHQESNANLVKTEKMTKYGKELLIDGIWPVGSDNSEFGRGNSKYTNWLKVDSIVSVSEGTITITAAGTNYSYVRKVLNDLKIGNEYEMSVELNQVISPIDVLFHLVNANDFSYSNIKSTSTNNWIELKQTFVASHNQYFVDIIILDPTRKGSVKFRNCTVFELLN